MDLSILSSLAIIGVAVSLLVQALKNHFDEVKTQIIVVGLSVVAGILYFFLKAHTNLLLDFVTILAAADTIYSYFLQYLEKPKPPGGGY